MKSLGKITGLAFLSACLVFGTLAVAQADDAMSKTNSTHTDAMTTDAMHSGAMHSDSMQSTKHDSMAHDSMGHDSMTQGSHDSMAPKGN